MAEVKWIKIATDIFNNKKIRLIESMPDSDSIIVIWFKLLMLAGNVNDGGAVYFTKDIPYTDQMLATLFNRPLTTVQLALSTFEKFEMIEIVNEIIQVSNWEKYQNVDRLEEIREYNRLAKQRSRAKKKLLVEDVNDKSMTSQRCHDTDIDIEVDKDITLKSNKANRYYEDDSLNKAFEDYVKMRKNIKKPMSDRAIELAKTKLNNLGNGNTETMIAILDQSVFYSWQGLFELKEERKNNGRVETDREESVEHPFDYRTLLK